MRQRQWHYRFPCNSGAAVIARTRGALLLSCTQAIVAEFRRQTLGPDEQRAPGDELLPRALTPKCDHQRGGDAVGRVDERID